MRGFAINNQRNSFFLTEKPFCISTSVHASHILARIEKPNQKRHFMKTFSMLLAVSAVFVLLTLSGCGQTGPLYLPDDTEKSE